MQVPPPCFPMGLGIRERAGPGARTLSSLGSVLSHVMLPGMAETLEIPFSTRDKRALDEWKKLLDSEEEQEKFADWLEESTKEEPLQRDVITLPAIEASTEKTREEIEEALERGEPLPKHGAVKLPKEMVENAKAAFIATGGNISQVAQMYDLTNEAVLRLASQENWPVYGGGTSSSQSMSKAQLTTMRDKIWKRIEIMLDAMEVEEKKKLSLVQHRSNSRYVEPLSARSQAFKILMDQYMRISTILEPETFSDDPDGSNMHARKARESQYPGGVEGVNREMADFLSEVVVGVADKIKERELQGYGDVIDARVE